MALHINTHLRYLHASQTEETLKPPLLPLNSRSLIVSLSNVKTVTTCTAESSSSPTTYASLTRLGIHTVRSGAPAPPLHLPLLSAGVNLSGQPPFKLSVHVVLFIASSVCVCLMVLGSLSSHRVNDYEDGGGHLTLLLAIHSVALPCQQGRV
ncbi:unnamed protein product [Pleuronectes platessa]|uniref:Uncharacterized protein n=1 Tax=Pleuronectes platessa TaxID=8262 RepID=A0A9N7TM57_PLEPL|nr:unnamed protein product [Pleuronectes platessa]